MNRFNVPSNCPFCGVVIKDETSFRDALSWREYHLSGLCQACQDKIFSNPTIDEGGEKIENN